MSGFRLELGFIFSFAFYLLCDVERKKIFFFFGFELFYLLYEGFKVVFFIIFSSSIVFKFKC